MTISDHRVDGYFLMDSFVPLAIIIASYLYFVLKLGPKLMEYRKPFNINSLLTLYNALQIIANAYVIWLV